MSDPSAEIAALAKRLFDLKADKKILEDRLKEVNLAIEDVANYKLPQMMDDAEISKQTIAGFGTIYRTQKVIAYCDAADREKFYAWLRDKGHGDMVIDYVFPQTVNAFAKEQMAKRGNEYFPDVLKVSLLQTVGTRRDAASDMGREPGEE